MEYLGKEVSELSLDEWESCGKDSKATYSLRSDLHVNLHPMDRQDVRSRSY